MEQADSVTVSTGQVDQSSLVCRTRTELRSEIDRLLRTSGHAWLAADVAGLTFSELSYSIPALNASGLAQFSQPFFVRRHVRLTGGTLFAYLVDGRTEWHFHAVWYDAAGNQRGGHVWEANLADELVHVPSHLMHGLRFRRYTFTEGVDGFLIDNRGISPPAPEGVNAYFYWRSTPGTNLWEALQHKVPEVSRYSHQLMALGSFWWTAHAGSGQPALMEVLSVRSDYESAGNILVEAVDVNGTVHRLGQGDGEASIAVLLDCLLLPL